MCACARPPGARSLVWFRAFRAATDRRQRGSERVCPADVRIDSVSRSPSHLIFPRFAILVQACATSTATIASQQSCCLQKFRHTCLKHVAELCRHFTTEPLGHNAVVHVLSACQQNQLFSHPECGCYLMQLTVRQIIVCNSKVLMSVAPSIWQCARSAAQLEFLA